MHKNVSRRKFIQQCLAGSTVLAANSFIPQTLQAKQSNIAEISRNKPGDRPNILLIVTDNMGRDLGCYGNEVIKTHNIDQLASEGIKFTNAFCTTSSCSPSRAVLLSGLYGHANGMYGLSHAYHHFSSFDDMESLPMLLARSGYRTGCIGKYHVAPESVYPFDVFMEVNSRNPVEMANTSQKFISDDPSRPFFLWFAPYDPHRGRPFNTWPKPNTFANRAEGYEGITPVTYDPEEVIVPPYLTDTQKCREELAQYYQSISRVDQGIGRLVAMLKEEGHYENTVIVFLSDNGPAFPGALATLYEPGMRLPCIVKTPTQKKRGIDNNALINWVDITPTLADYAGLSVSDDHFQGRSFRSILENPNPSGWDEIYASHTFHEVTMYTPMRVVRGRKYKLIWNIAHEQEQPVPRDIKNSSTLQSLINRNIKYLGKRPIQNFLHRPEFELYDLENDPYEVNNLANKEAYGNVLEKMKKKLRTFQEKTEDPWIIMWEGRKGLKVIEEH